MKDTLSALNDGSEKTSTLVLKGDFSLADFKDLPPYPKLTKLVLDVTSNESSGITQETSLNIAATFPNLEKIEAQGLSDASGKIISEMLETTTLKSLKMENVDKQVDTLSGPLHNMSSNHLTELVYSETPNNPRSGNFLGFLVDVQLDKLLDTSTHLKSLSLSGHINWNDKSRCDKFRIKTELTHFEMKNSPNMAEEYLAYMIDVNRNLEHITLSNNSNGVGTSFTSLLKTDPDSNIPWFPELKHLTFWENAIVEPEVTPKGGSYASQVEGSLKQLGTYAERLNQLDLKVGDGVSEDAVIQATASLKPSGKLTLGLSQQVTEQTVEKIKAQRPDLDITTVSHS